MEAYKVWVTLNLKGDALKKMEMFTAATKLATAAVDKLKIAMRPNLSMFDQMAVNLREINPQLSRMAQNINSVDNASRRLNRTSMTSRRGGGGIGRGGLNNFGMGLTGGLGLYNPYIRAGADIGAALVSGYHHGNEYQRSMGQLSAMGYNDKQLNFVKKFTSTAKPGVSTVSQIDSFVAAQMETQSFEMSKALAPILAQNKMVSQVLYGGMSNKQTQDAIKTAGMIGGSNPAKVAEAMTTILQMTALSSGSMMPSEQRSFMRQAAGSASRLTPMGYLSLEPVMQEYGGSKTGTALTTGLRAFSNPKISNFAQYKVKQLEDLGLWDTKNKRMKSEYLEQLQTDPSQFAKTWLSHLSAHGITSESDILTNTMSALPRTFGTLLSLLMKNMEKSDRERAIISGLPKGEGLTGIVSKTQAGAAYRVSQGWVSFSEALNRFSSPVIIDAMNILGSGLEKMATFLNSHSLNSNNSLRNVLANGSSSNGLFDFINKKGDLTSGSINQKNQPIVTQVNLDGKVIATTMSNRIGDALWGHQLVQNSTSGNNPLMPYPVGLSNNGSF